MDLIGGKKVTDSGMEESDTDYLSLCGWMSVRIGEDPTKSRVFCHLTQGRLEIFSDPNAAHPRKTIAIAESTKITYDQYTNSEEFSVEDCFFIADNSDEAFKWASLLKSMQSVSSEKLSISDFRILSVIGRGFYGKVMLVQKKSTGELFALKSIRKQGIIDSGRPERVIAERNILLLIQHPFIVHLHFSFQTNTKFYMGLDYAPGGDLFFHLSKQGTIPIAGARLYTAEIALALDHLHRCGIIYRDLKPENVLIDVQGHALLTDFGLAKDLDESQGTSTMCGTRNYMSPERIAGRPYGFPSDWWSMGILICEMLSGFSPFQSDNSKKLLDSIVNDPPCLPKGMDEVAVDLILRLLQKDPRNRPRFADIMDHPFFDDLDWEVVMARRYKPLFVPEESSVSTAKYFDREFTDEKATDSERDDLSDGNGEDTMRIEGFSFNEAEIMRADALAPSSLVPPDAQN